MLYKNNQFKRTPPAMREFTRIEKKTVKELAKSLNAQSSSVVTKNFVNDVYNFWKELHRTIKKQDDFAAINEAELDEYLEEQLKTARALDEASNKSKQIKEVIRDLIIAIVVLGIHLNKKKYKALFSGIKNDHAQEIAERIDLNEVNLTNESVLLFIGNYVDGVVIGLNSTSRTRIKNFIKRRIIKGDTPQQILTNLLELEAINMRRGWTITRTEMYTTYSFITRIYLTKLAFEFWRWVCNTPEDIECLMNCGVIRRIGEPFPSGHVAPIVHPNGECVVEGALPTNKFDLDLALATMALTAIDWSGD